MAVDVPAEQLDQHADRQHDHAAHGVCPFVSHRRGKQLADVYRRLATLKPVTPIRDLTDGFGVDYAFEAVGQPDVLQQALASRDLAGVGTVIGVPGRGTSITLDLPRYFDLGGSLRVSWYGDNFLARVSLAGGLVLER
ncbi:MAG: zinc-binding dehydrogenase [Chloroflexi bacterium]|nr:zinc-binding dehydrogenase [Chloroflexota bacterium]